MGMDKETKKTLLDPLHVANPITLQVLGICSALAVTTTKRFAAIPDVPTVKELGHPNMETIIGWSGIFGPPGMDKAAADKWIATLQELKKDKAFNKLIKGLGSIPDIRNPEDTKSFVKAQYETFRGVVQKLGIEVK